MSPREFDTQLGAKCSDDIIGIGCVRIWDFPNSGNIEIERDTAGMDGGSRPAVNDIVGRWVPAKVRRGARVMVRHGPVHAEQAVGNPHPAKYHGPEHGWQCFYTWVNTGGDYRDLVAAVQ